MTAKQEKILLHSLGVNDLELPKECPKIFYRNRYISPTGTDSHSDCSLLRDMGFMSNRDSTFFVTSKGISVVKKIITKNLL